MSEVKRRVYKDNEMFQARLEDVDGVIFLHIEVKQMKKKTIDALLDEFPDFKSKIKSAGYKFLYTYSRTPKFYEIFKGYEVMGDMEWEGENYKVLRWELN